MCKWTPQKELSITEGIVFLRFGSPLMLTPVFIAAPSDGWALVYPWFTTDSSVFTLSIIIQVSFLCLAEMALSRCPQSSIPLLKQVHGRCWNTEKRRAVGAVGMKGKAEDDSSIKCNWMMSWRNRKLWMRKLGPLKFTCSLSLCNMLFHARDTGWRRKPAISWCSYRSFQGTCKLQCWSRWIKRFWKVHRARLWMER